MTHNAAHAAHTKTDRPAALEWHFPPTRGGIAHGFNDSGKEFFKADIMEHVVREIMQNSLDAKDTRHPDRPVVVTLKEIGLAREAVGADSLAGHMRESLRAVQAQKSRKGESFYKNALKVLKKPLIPTLAVVDENTTGLGGPRWGALVYREGTPSKDGAAAGGSFGIGKNAPYAASSLGLVCYSTRYLDRQRVEWFIARCKLVAHADPEDGHTELQHVGFGTSKGFDGSRFPPVVGRDIDRVFRLKGSGTGIFIVGFDGRRGWEDAAVRSTARSFFAAIHDGKLRVHVNGHAITNETLSGCLGGVERQYHDLYMTAAKPVLIEGRFGRFLLKIGTGGDDMQNRVAYVNRRGMLITDSKTFNRNPFGAHIEIGKYAAVVWAADDDTDARVREMEPPTHESIEYRRIEDVDRRRDAEKDLREIADRIRDEIRKRLDFESDEQTELSELSDIIPYVSDPAKGSSSDGGDGAGMRRRIGSRSIPVKPAATHGGERDESGEGSGAGPGDDDGAGGGSGSGGGSGGAAQGRAKAGKAASNMGNIRVMRSGKTLRVAFDSRTRASKFVIRPAGEEYQAERPVALAGVVNVSGAKSVRVLDETVIRSESEPGSRVILDVSPAKQQQYTGYSIQEYLARGTK